LTSPKWNNTNIRFWFSYQKVIQYSRKGVIAMDCTTVKPGVECVFMSKKGCSFNGGACYHVVEQCQGCDRSSEYPSGWFCTACPDPKLKWKNGKCNLATHVKDMAKSEAGKINPLKASKRNAR
jgi:hypothetical protein